MAQPGIYQASFNAGELSLELHGRTDVKQFYSGAKRMRNIEPVPQGGFRLTPRTIHEASVRPRLQEVAGAVLDVEDSAVSVAGVIATIDLVAPVAVECVDMTGFKASASIDAALQLEAEDSVGAWHPIGLPFAVRLSDRSRRAAVMPGSSIVSDRLRVRLVVAPVAPVTFTIDSVDVFTAAGPAVDAVNLSFTFSQTQTYQIVFGERHADIFRSGLFVGAVRHGYDGSDLLKIKEEQRFDSMLLFLDTRFPQRLMRVGADHEWSFDAIPFAAIPDVDYGGDYPKVTDEWEIFLRYPTTGDNANGAGLYMALTVNDEETPGLEIATPPNWAAYATAIKNALEALPSVGPGVTVGQVASTGLTKFTIAFAGDENNGQLFSLTARVVNSGNAAASTTHKQLGSKGGEALISDLRGYPRCAAFYQDRLFTGGFRSKTSGLLGSVTGDYFNSNIEIEGANGAILVNLDTEGAEVIEHIARGRHLVIFTSDAEYFIADRAIVRTQPPNVVQCSRNGVAEYVPVVESEGQLLYVSRNRSLVYSAAYSDASQAYDSDPLSLLASHLMFGIRGAALQRSSTNTDANRYFLPRDDGVMVIGVMIRNQEVTAFIPWETDGKVRSISVDGANIGHMIVERQVAGQPRLFLEKLDAGVFLDGTIIQTLEDPVTVITGLDIHEGATVWAETDGYVVGPFIVTDATITLPFEASVVKVGRWTPPIGKTLPLPSEIAERTVLKRPRRVHTVRANVIGTTSIAIGANGQPARDVDLYRFGQPTDVPLPPVTGQINIGGLVGFSDDGEVEFTQVRPGWLQVRDITVEARI